MGLAALAWAVLLLSLFVSQTASLTPAGAILIATVFAAVYHAEVVAHRIGEPFGTLVLAVAVTVIEVALIVSLMLAAPAEKAALARDTVFAAVMIVCNGIVGLCLSGAACATTSRAFTSHGASAALAVLATLTTLTLVLPNFATSCARPVLQHVAARVRRRRFAGALRLVRVRADGAPPRLLPARPGRATRKRMRRRRPTRPRWSAWLLLVSLVAMVGLAKRSRRRLERLARPKCRRRSWASLSRRWCCCRRFGGGARRAANRLQTSLNLALGSALATIGLTIPVVAAVVDRATHRSSSGWPEGPGAAGPDAPASA